MCNGEQLVRNTVLYLHGNNVHSGFLHHYIDRFAFLFCSHYKEPPSFAQQVPWTPPEPAGGNGVAAVNVGPGGGPTGMGDPLLLSPTSSSSSPAPSPAFPTDPPPKCAEVSGLSAGQAKLCLLYEEHLSSIRYGVQSGLTECRSQFLHRRWNCSMNAENVGAPFLGPDLQTSMFTLCYTHIVHHTAMSGIPR